MTKCSANFEQAREDDIKESILICSLGETIGRREHLASTASQNFTRVTLCPGTFAAVFGGFYAFFGGIRTQGFLPPLRSSHRLFINWFLKLVLLCVLSLRC